MALSIAAVSLRERLFAHSHAGITLDQLESLSDTPTYEQFAAEIQQLSKEGELIVVKLRAHEKIHSLFIQ